MQTDNSKNIAIIDYNMGNVFSLMSACKKIGHNAFVTNEKDQITKADIILLPGVGAFADAMKNIQKLKLDELIVEQVNKGKPLIGICLGMQLLLNESNEFGKTRGLGLIEGQVLPLPKQTDNGELIRIPHLGWSKISNMLDQASTKIIKHIHNNNFQYFAHSFYAKVENKNDILALSSYRGFEFASAIKKDNIIGFQFHPEKSGPQGLELLSSAINSFHLKVPKTEQNL